uniref:Uncharacterized protein n=1 Tax=Romanomermis culicivorax TaxID=13658 RepID=A0A915I891_ROMCU
MKNFTTKNTAPIDPASIVVSTIALIEIVPVVPVIPSVVLPTAVATVAALAIAVAVVASTAVASGTIATSEASSPVTAVATFEAPSAIPITHSRHGRSSPEAHTTAAHRFVAAVARPSAHHAAASSAKFQAHTVYIPMPSSM